MVKIDNYSFPDRRGVGAFKAPPPPGLLAVWNIPDRIGLNNCTDYKGYYIIFIDQNIISYGFICI